MRKKAPGVSTGPFSTDCVAWRLIQLDFCVFQPKKQMKFSESVIKTGEGLLTKS